MGTAGLFGVWFPEERRSSEGAGTEGREVLVLVSISAPLPL